METDEQKTERLKAAKALYVRILGALDRQLHDDLTVREVEGACLDREIAELRGISKFYGMLAARRRREFLTRHRKWRAWCLDQKGRRAAAAQKLREAHRKREESF